MTAIILFTVVALVLIVQTVRYAIHDGLGSTQPPRSHSIDAQLAAPSAGLGVRV